MTKINKWHFISDQKRAIGPKISCRFSIVSKVAILKIDKMAFFKFLTSALAMENSLGLDFLFCFYSDQLLTYNTMYFVISVFFV